MNELKDKVALITGGSRGIGRAIALKLGAFGCHVAFSYVAHKEAALEVEKQLHRMGVKAKASCVDVGSFEEVEAWVQKTKEELGHLDILINNAGIVIDKPLMMMSEEDWKRVIETNLNGMFHASKSCIVTFMKQKSGNIVNISSVSGIIGLAGQTNYSASKGGMNAFTKALAKEVAGFGIRVNAVAPGFIDTEILAHLKEEQRKEILRFIPMERVGSPEDVANCVAFLLSKKAEYITGQILQVDGGLALR
ncbi:MAG TPA: 3-oxoacyl-[acyl-carrier-protein] reductase [Candidatus Omnitrophota bacterium]|nr:3-oxoacyl-[acyl-carrier-protein] reductase [Candidatus Omnitrophota bacterium]